MNDEDHWQNLAFGAAFADSIQHQFRIPVWNPYFGGGVPWAGYPRNPSLTPMGLLIGGFGEIVGLKLWIALIGLGGTIGFYLIARKPFEFDRQSALVGSLIYCTALWLPGRLWSGNYGELSLFLTPICLYCFYGALERRWFGVFLPFLYLAISGSAKFEPFLIAGFVLLFAFAFRGRLGQNLKDISLVWGLTLLVFVLLALPKLLPLLRLLNMNLANLIEGVEVTGMEWRFFLLSLTQMNPEATHLVVGLSFGALALAVVGILRNWSFTFPILSLLAIFILLVMGPEAPLPLWRGVLVPMSNFPKYWNVFVLFLVTMLAVNGWSWLRSTGRQLLHRLFPGLTQSQTRGVQAAIFILIAVLVVAPSWWQAQTMYSRVFTERPPSATVTDDFHHVADEELLNVVSLYRGGSGMYARILQKVGNLTWYGNFVFEENAVPRWILGRDSKSRYNQDYEGEVTSIRGDANISQTSTMELGYGTIKLHFIEPILKPTVVGLNFNYDENWHTSKGAVIEHSGRLAIQLKPQQGVPVVVTLNYVDWLFRIGVASFIITLVIWPLYFLRVFVIRTKCECTDS